jgi:outer membrane protein assembly factor BamB/predicted MPP superfamily phosphohydrolase
MSIQIRLISILIILLYPSFLTFGQEHGNSIYQAKRISFAVLTDMHVNPGSASDSALSRIVEEINNTRVDFTIVTGDLSNTGSDAELYAVKRSLDKLVKPCYVLPGNHETNWSESAGLTMRKLWGADRFVFTSNGIRMVGFNTGPYMKMGDGHVKQEDLGWLENQLLRKSKDQIQIAFAHYPLSEGLDNWPEVTRILKNAECKIVFCGHGHSLRLFNFNGIPGIMCRSVILGKSNVPGYNIINLRNDSVIVFNKPLFQNAIQAITLNYLNPDTLSVIPVSQFPDFSMNKDYSNRKVIAEWTDSASVFSGPCLVNDSILVYGNSLGYINALSTRSHQKVWQLKIAGPVYSTPVASGNTVVLGTVDGSIIGIDALKGNMIWKVVTGRPVLAEGIIEHGSVYIGGGDSIFYKINISNGKVIWKYPGITGLVQGKPALSESSVVFGAWDTYLYSLDKETGKLNWKWSNKKQQVLYSPGNIFPVCTGNRVFIVAPDRFMTALDISTGKEIWRTGRHHVRESMGASADGKVVYAKLMNDTVIAVSATADLPSTLWKVDTGFGYEHNPCPVTTDGDMVVASTRDGLIVAIDSRTRKVLWKYKAGTSSVNKVVADNHHTLWLTLMEGRILGIKTDEHYYTHIYP